MREHNPAGEQTDERSDSTGVHKKAWQRTLADMKSLAEDHEDAGRTVVQVIADDTAPESPDAGDSNRFGFVHVIPRNHASEVSSIVRKGEFPSYNVYSTTVDGRVFLVTELLDPDIESAIVIASTYEQQRSDALRETALERGEIYTYLQKVDRTHVAAFTHGKPEKFFPRSSSV